MMKEILVAMDGTRNSEIISCSKYEIAKKLSSRGVL